MTAQDHQETPTATTTLADILARYVDSEGTFEGGDPFPVTIRYLNDHADVVGTAEAELFHAAEAAARQVTELRVLVEGLRDHVAAVLALLSAGDKAEPTGCAMYGHKTPQKDCVYCLGHAALAGDRAEAPRHE